MLRTTGRSYGNVARGADALTQRTNVVNWSDWAVADTAIVSDTLAHTGVKVCCAVSGVTSRPVRPPT